MPHRGARVSLIEGPISDAVEKHRRSPGEDHAKEDERQEPERWPAMRRDEKRAEREGHGEDGVRKPDQTEEARQAAFVRLGFRGHCSNASSRARAEARIGVPW